MSTKKNTWISLAKRLAQKTTKLIDEQVEKLEKNGVPDKIEQKIEQSGAYVGKKIEQFKKSDIPDKIDHLVERTDKSVRETISKLQAASSKTPNKPTDLPDVTKDSLHGKTGHTDKRPRQ